MLEAHRLWGAQTLTIRKCGVLRGAKIVSSSITIKSHASAQKTAISLWQRLKAFALLWLDVHIAVIIAILHCNDSKIPNIHKVSNCKIQYLNTLTISHFNAKSLQLIEHFCVCVCNTRVFRVNWCIEHILIWHQDNLDMTNTAGRLDLATYLCLQVRWNLYSRLNRIESAYVNYIGFTVDQSAEI